MARLFEAVKTQLCVTPTAGAAGQTTITSSAVDTTGFDAVRFLVVVGAITTGGVQSFKLQQSDDDGAGDSYGDIVGTSQTIADDADDTHVYSDIFRPQKRYLKVVISRATQNATFGGVIAELYEPRTVPVTQTASGETYISPAEGTA